MENGEKKTITLKTNNLLVKAFLEFILLLNGPLNSQASVML
jgi:hypothetical protein